MLTSRINISCWAWLFVFLLVFIGSLCLIWFTLPGQHLYDIDTIELIPVLGIDDAYRYFLAKQAWSDSSLYQWNYILPLALALDGLLVSLFDGNIFVIRVVKLFITFASYYFLYRTAVKLQISRNIAALSVLLLAVMPVFTLVSISFLGEAWLLNLFICFLFFFVHKRYGVAVLLVGLMPLIRLEGVFLVIMLSLWALRHRRYWYVVVLILPGFAYFLWLVYSLEHLSDYLQWREEYREYTYHYKTAVFQYFSTFFATYNLVWLSIAVVGLWVVRRSSQPWLWVFAAVVWFYAFLLEDVHTANATYEPRYFTGFMPLAALLWGVGVTRLLNTGYLVNKHKTKALLLVLVVVCIAFNHLLQVDAVRAKLTDGKRFPYTDNTGAELSLKGNDGERSQNIKDVLDGTYQILEDLPQIETIFIPMQKDVFYYLDPNKLGARKIVITPNTYGPIVELFGGSLYGMHTEGKQYSYYHFTEREGRVGTLPGLYLGDLSGCVNCYYFHRNKDFGSYLLFFTETDEPLRRPSKDEFYELDVK